MTPLWIVLAAAVAAVGGVWQLRRRAAALRRRCRRRLSELLARERPAISLTEPAPGRWRLESGGNELATVDGKALTRAATGGEDRCRRLFLAVADAAATGPRPFAGGFDLKSHGARVLPRLADDGLALLGLEPAVRHTAADAGDLPTIYLLDGEPRPVYLTDEHLAAAGIDARDLHGVALAVLRQRFDESLPRAALAGGEAVAVEAPDGCGGSRLLLLPEALRAGETLFASAPTPDLLLLAADRGTLDTALAAAGEPLQPLPPAIFRVTAGGLRRES